MHLMFHVIYCTTFVMKIGEEKSTVIGLMRKAIAQQLTDEVCTVALGDAE